MPLVVVVRSHATAPLRSSSKAPSGFGEHPDTYHSDVIFLKAPLTAKQAMRTVELRDGVDEAWTGTGVLYFARLSARRTQSRMSKIVGTPEYQRMTIRSWATTTKLVAMLDDRRRLIRATDSRVGQIRPSSATASRSLTSSAAVSSILARL